MKIKMRKEPWERLEARVSSPEKSLLATAARLEGRSMTDFVVSCAVENARRVIREHDRVVLSEKDQRTFVEALLNPPEPNARLRAAYKKYLRDFHRS